MKKDYNSYFFTKGEWIKYWGEGFLICAGINYLFYESWILLLCMLPLPFLFLKWKRKQLVKNQKRVLNHQFKDALDALNVALQAGYSAENAVFACCQELEKIYSEDADIVKEFRYFGVQLNLKVPLEKLFLDFGKRSRVEDIENFAVIFQTAKRTGGDMKTAIEKTAQMLGEKIEVQKEIEATLAAKKSEQMIMSFMPCGIIMYMRLTSPGFLDVLYGNLFGMTAMTICLAVYGTAWWMGRRIVEIQV